MRDKNSIEAEVIDHQFNHHGQADDLGWDAHNQNQFRPDEMMMQAEEGGKSGEIDQRTVDRIRTETLMKIFDNVLSDWRRRPDPADVGRKVLAMAKFSGHRSVDGMSLGELGRASGETKAATSHRIKRMCNKPIEAAGGLGKAKFQQGPDQCAVSAQAQRGNKNRAKNK